MASFLQRMILIALIFTIVFPISMGHRDISEKRSNEGDDSDRDEEDDSEIRHYLRDLCSDTKHQKETWKIIEPETNRFTNTNSRNVAYVVFDLAIAKSSEINDKLDQLHDDSQDDELKKKYDSCSENYNDVNRDLVIAKTNLDDNDYRKISNEVNDVVQKLKNCRHSFDKKSSDPAHIRDRNKEFGLYVEIVKAATNRFLSDKNRDRKS